MLAVRLAPIRQQDNLKPETEAKMETTTTMKEDFKGMRSTPAVPQKPVYKKAQVEPFQTSTENRQEFTYKPFDPVKPYRLKDNQIMAGKFEGATNYSTDFGKYTYAKATSYAPHTEYKKPAEKFGNQTTFQSDFPLYKDVRKLPYSKQGQPAAWQQPTERMVTNSTYKVDFPITGPGERIPYQPPSSTIVLGKESSDHTTMYNEDFIMKPLCKLSSYAPSVQYRRPGVKMQCSTEMLDSFKGEFLLPPESFRPKKEIAKERPAMECQTLYNDDFQQYSFVTNDEMKEMSRVTSPEKKRKDSLKEVPKRKNSKQA